VLISIERWACKRAAELIAELGGGKVTAGFIDNYPNRIGKLNVPLRLSHKAYCRCGIFFDTVKVLGKLILNSFLKVTGNAL
jgi:hypothetical protein